MRCAGRVDGEPSPCAGMWLERYDPTGRSGRGWVRWTGNRADGMRFTDPSTARAAQAAVPIMAAFRVEIEPAP